MKRKDLIKILLQSGADITIKEGKTGKTPIEIAQARKDASEILEVFEQVQGFFY